MAIDKNEYSNKIENNLWANNNYTIFFYNFVFDKKRYRGLINLAEKTNWSKKDKISYAKAEIHSIKNTKKHSTQNENITLDAFVEEYFSFLPITKYTKLRKRHYEMYVSPVCGDKKMINIRQLHIREAIKLQEEGGLAPRTVKQTLEALNPAFKNAIANRLITFNPCDGIKIKLPNTKKIVTFATEELKKIHEAILQEFHDDSFYLTFFLFALQGRRKSEIIFLKWDDVNLEKNYYVLRNTKNNEEQKLFLPENIKENLLKIPKVGEYVFTSSVTGTHLIHIQRVVTKLKNRLENHDFGLHYMRNVIVSAMAEQGLDSIYLSGALGHNDPNTIKKYLTMNYLKSSEMASGVIDGIVKR